MPDKITIQPRPNHRVGVFVDMQNLYHSAKNLHGARINFAELVKLASADRQIVRALVYVVKSGETEEKAFFDALEKSGLELKMKDLQVFAGGAKKADWDVGMAVDVISLMKQLDVVVLATGDTVPVTVTCPPFTKYGASDSARLPNRDAFHQMVGLSLPWLSATEKEATAVPSGR